MKPRHALLLLALAPAALFSGCRTITPGPVTPTPVPPREEPLPEERKPIEPPRVPTPTTGASPTDPNTLRRTSPDKPLWTP